MIDRKYDVVVIGGGIIGLATSMKLTQDLPILLSTVRKRLRQETLIHYVLLLVSAFVLQGQVKGMLNILVRQLLESRLYTITKKNLDQMLNAI